MSEKKRVLFLCTGNSARSQMAEGLLRHLAGEAYVASSAGTHPRGLHPKAVAVMKESGIDVSRHRSKNVNEFLDQSFDYLITVCDRAREQCPIVPGVRAIHWTVDDPAEAVPERQLEAFRQVRDAIRQQLLQFITRTRQETRCS